MALTYKTRKRLSILALVVGLPLYIILAVTVMNLFNRPPAWVELVVYAVLGILWAFPLKKIFEGVGRADPDAPPED